MKQRIQYQIVFIGKSMRWSVLLYVAIMLVVYREDISNTITGKKTTAVVTTQSVQPPPGNATPVAAKHIQVVNKFAAIIRSISGYASLFTQ